MANKRLLIDVGNTRIKWLMLNNRGEEISQAIACSAYTHKGEFEQSIQQCFANLNPADQSEYDIIVSNVAGRLAQHSLESFFNAQWKNTPFFISVTRQEFGIENRYLSISELGVDRWIALIGSRMLYQQGAIIVINCGTAITVDLLDTENVFRGGAILPGFDLGLSALSKADGIDLYDSKQLGSDFGVSTSECVRIGVTAACVGGVERIILKMCSNLDDFDYKNVNIIVSGGGAIRFLAETNLHCEYDANLILRGLNRFS